MDEAQLALDEYRQKVLLYIEEKIDWVEFWKSFAKIMAPFDPLSWSLNDLSRNQKKEVLFYYEWHGGEFGESEERIPKLKSWKYGESMELYGWVDKKAYFKNFKSAVNELRIEIGI